MSRIKPYLIAVVWLFLLNLNVTLGSKVTLTASSPAIQPPLTPTLNLRCSLEDTASSSSMVGRSLSETPTNVMVVSSMFLFREDEDIATVSEHIPAHAVGNALNLNISGAIPGDKPGEKGFLEVSMIYPTEAQGGNYTCRISAIDDVGHPVIYSDSIDVTVTSPTINDLVHHIMIQDQKHNVKVSLLEHENQKYNAKITLLESKDKMQDQLIHELQDELDVTKHVEGGVISCGGDLGSVDAPLSRTSAVTFTSPYRHAPLVHVAVHDAGLNKDFYAHFHVTLVTVDTQGFTVQCDVNDHGHYLGFLQLSWLSFPV